MNQFLLFEGIKPGRPLLQSKPTTHTERGPGSPFINFISYHQSPVRGQGGRDSGYCSDNSTLGPRTFVEPLYSIIEIKDILLIYRPLRSKEPTTNSDNRRTNRSLLNEEPLSKQRSWRERPWVPKGNKGPNVPRGRPGFSSRHETEWRNSSKRWRKSLGRWRTWRFGVDDCRQTTKRTDWVGTIMEWPVPWHHTFPVLDGVHSYGMWQSHWKENVGFPAINRCPIKLVT